MKRLKIIPLIFMVLSIALMDTGCNMVMHLNCIKVKGKKITTETRKSEYFSGVVVEIPAQVFLSIGDEQKIEISAKRRVLDQILTTVEDDRLILEYDTCIKNPDSITVYITVQELDYVRIAGSGSVSGKELIETDEIELKIDGSGDIDLELEAGTVHTKINGSGDIHLEGSAKSLVIGINGSGDVRAGKLKSQRVKVKINGSGDCKVHAVKKLDVKINGSGDVRYKGDPEITKTINGTGSIKRK